MLWNMLATFLKILAFYLDSIKYLHGEQNHIYVKAHWLLLWLLLSKTLFVPLSTQFPVFLLANDDTRSSHCNKCALDTYPDTRFSLEFRFLR